MRGSATLLPWPNPKWKENPYQALLYRALEPHGVRVLRTPWLFSLLPFRRRFDWLHLNWPDTLYRSSDPARRERRLESFARTLERLKRRGTRILWTVHNEFPHDAHDLEFHRRANATLVELADLIHVHFAAARTLLRGYGADADRILLLPHGHYGDHYGAPVAKAEARASLGIPEGAGVLLSLGYLRPYKGLERAVESFEACAKGDLRYLIAGEPASDGIAAFLRAAGERDSRLLLHLRKLEEREFPCFLCAADAFLFPSRRFFTSGSVVLALGYGLPVIAVPRNHTLEFAGTSYFRAWTPPEPEVLTRIMEELDGWLGTVDAGELRQVRTSLDWERLAPALARRLVSSPARPPGEERAELAGPTAGPGTA